jgi:hypothetical protein
LTKKRIAAAFGRIFVPWIGRRADERYDTGTKYPRQTVERRQIGGDFAAFDLADVCPWHSHAESDISLGEPIQLSEVENVKGYAVAN